MRTSTSTKGLSMLTNTPVPTRPVTVPSKVSPTRERMRSARCRLTTSRSISMVYSRHLSEKTRSTPETTVCRTRPFHFPFRRRQEDPTSRRDASPNNAEHPGNHDARSIAIMNPLTTNAHQRHVIISGGSKGLGRALVVGLLEAGYRVSTFSRSRTEFIDQVVDNPNFFYDTGDVSAMRGHSRGSFANPRHGSAQRTDSSTSPASRQSAFSLSFAMTRSTRRSPPTSGVP